MLRTVGRSRVPTGVAVVLTVVGAGTVLGAGSPAHSGSPVHSGGTTPAASSLPFVGPVAARPHPRPHPLVRSGGSWLAGDRVDRLAPVLRQMGPQPVGAALVGPSGVVGPGSPPAQVRAAQRLLNTRGAQLSVDGAWGPATTRAVRRLQLRAGLPADGRLGPVTAAELLRQ